MTLDVALTFLFLFVATGVPLYFGLRQLTKHSIATREAVVRMMKERS